MRKDVKIENPTNPSGPHFRARLPRVEIEILRGRARDLVREVTFPVFLIGTADDCDLVLGDARTRTCMSPKTAFHCAIWVAVPRFGFRDARFIKHTSRMVTGFAPVLTRFAFVSMVRRRQGQVDDQRRCIGGTT